MLRARLLQELPSQHNLKTEVSFALRHLQTAWMSCHERNTMLWLTFSCLAGRRPCLFACFCSNSLAEVRESSMYQTKNAHSLLVSTGSATYGQAKMAQCLHHPVTAFRNPNKEAFLYLKNKGYLTNSHWLGPRGKISAESSTLRVSSKVHKPHPRILPQEFECRKHEEAGQPLEFDSEVNWTRF